MSKTRLELSQTLHKICENCYYSPPNIGIVYPCILYELSNVTDHHADNLKYLSYKRYSLTLIDENPDSELFQKLMDLEFCSFDRYYVSDNLNHFVFTLFW